MDLTGLKFPSSSSYSIVGEIGRGGMGIVLLAEKNSEGVTDLVALKTIRTKSADHEARLKREANVATGLLHENVVKTYGLESVPYERLPEEFLREFDRLTWENARRLQLPKLTPGAKLADPRTRLRLLPGAGDRKLYLIEMDYIEGTDVRTFHHEHAKRDLLLPVPLAGFVASRLARALAYAHQFIIHRDISPENVLINMQGVVKLSDFGVAVGESESGVTGKLSYLSPEQVRGEAVDARTDLWSLGLVLYLLLTGVQPQRVPLRKPAEEGVEFVRGLHARTFPAPAEVRTDVPRELSDLCMKLLAPDRERRYATADDVARDLEQMYLYARGFGPTNNSMQAYLEIFDAGFRETTEEQLRQLPFLKGELRRSMDAAHYTAAGRKFVDEVQARCPFDPHLRRENSMTERVDRLGSTWRWPS